jgi:hypothetical protein
MDLVLPVGVDLTSQQLMPGVVLVRGKGRSDKGHAADQGNDGAE